MTDEYYVASLKMAHKRAVDAAIASEKIRGSEFVAVVVGTVPGGPLGSTEIARGDAEEILRALVWKEARLAGGNSGWLDGAFFVLPDGTSVRVLETPASEDLRLRTPGPGIPPGPVKPWLDGLAKWFGEEAARDAASKEIERLRSYLSGRPTG